MTRLPIVVLALLAVALVGVPVTPTPAAAEGGFQASTSILAGGAFGDGLEATRASLNYPWGVAVGPDGDVYIADTFHHQIRAVGPDGTIRRVAGIDEGFAGDGIDAKKARLNRPAGLDFDRDGRLLVADAGNHRVRRIDLRSGQITTVAGTGRRYSDAGDGGPATAADLSFPTDVAAGPDGSVYIVDTENHKVRRVTPDGRISTYAGTSDPCHAASDPDLVHCHPNDFDGQRADQVHIQPAGIAVDERGDVFIADQNTCSVRKVERGTRTITTVAGGVGCGYSGDGGAATLATLASPVGLDVDNGRLYIADIGNRRVRMVDELGVIRTVAGSGEPGCPQGGEPAEQATLMFPYAVDASGDDLYITDQGFFFGACSIGLALHVSAGTLSRFAGNGTAFAGGSGDPARSINFWNVRAVAWGPDGQPYFGETRGIWTVTRDGTALLVAGGENGDQDGAASEARFRDISALEFDEQGSLWIADAGAGKIKRLADGVVTTMAGGGPRETYGEDGPALEVNIGVVGLVLAPDGVVYFTDATDASGKLRVLRDGEVTTLGGVGENRYMAPIGDGGPVENALFRSPHGIERGPDGALYIADRQHHRIRRIDERGIIDTVAGDGGEASRGDGTIAPLASFSSPDDIVFDGAGNLFVTDGKNQETHQQAQYVVRQISPNGMVSRVAGTGKSGIGEGNALATPLENPLGLDSGADGLLIADRSTVRLVRAAHGVWPNPPRQVRCDSYFRDQEGDGRSQRAFLYSENQPWIDLLDGDVRTDATTMTVTFDLLDLDERVFVPPAAELGTAWSWVYRFKVGDKYRYLAAFAPSLSGATPTAVFEYGDSSMGRGASSYQLTRRGAATGTMDLDNDRVTITAPLSNLGLRRGDVVIYHEEHTGQLLETPTYRAIGGDGDTTSTPGYLPGSMRSYKIGKRCPEDF